MRDALDELSIAIAEGTELSLLLCGDFLILLWFFFVTNLSWSLRSLRCVRFLTRHPSPGLISLPLQT